MIGIKATHSAIWTEGGEDQNARRERGRVVDKGMVPSLDESLLLN